MILKGRRKIITEFSPEDMLDVKKVRNVINSAISTHLQNKSEIEYLINYRNGIQPILDKTKNIREEINNKVVVNHAQMITRNIIGYFLGTPIQYISSGLADKKEQIDLLNRFVAYENKSAIDKEIGELQSICGTAYRIIYTDGVLADKVPFEDKCLNPATTFVVYENTIAERPVLAVTYYDLYNEYGNKIGTKWYAYTINGVYEIQSSGNTIKDTDKFSFSHYNVGGIPIIEYPNNMWRVGDWELCIGLMDAINALHSGRLDDIDQIVQSLLVFINAEVTQENYDEMRKKGIVMLTNTTNNQSDVRTIQNNLDQSGMNLFATELENLLYALIGIPDRNNRTGGGGDTGQAVELRDGWADLEIIARNKELTFKRSEKLTLSIILNIMNNRFKTELSLLDIDIKFSRNKNNNLLVKTQGYMNLLKTKTLTPEDCLTIVDLVSDVNEFISRGRAFWGEEFAGKTPPQLQNNIVNQEETTSENELPEDNIE